MRFYLLQPLAGTALLIGCLWIPLGRRVLGALGAHGLGSACALALGGGTWGMLVLAVGVAGGLYPASLLGVAATLAIALRLDRCLLPEPIPPPAAPEPVEPSWPLRVSLAALAIACILVAAGGALAPEASFDALNVHLPYARDAARQHRLAFARNNWSSAMPALPLMSYVTSFVFAGVEMAKLCNLSAFLATGGVVYAFVRRRASRLHAGAAATLFWSGPIVLYEATTALIDLPLTLYSALTTLALLEWSRTGARAFLVLSAVALGLALGCKYHAAFWILPSVLVVVVISPRAGGSWSRSAARAAMLYLGIAALVSAPWFVRAWAYTGNPVFPAANRLFRSPYFTPAMEAAAQAAYANEGIGTSFGALARLPWQVAFHPGPFRGTLGPIFLVGVAVAAATAWRRRDGYLGCALLLACAYFAAWAVTAQESRYLLPMAPLLSVVTALALLPGVARPPAGVRHALAWTGGIVIVLAGVANLPPFYSRWVADWTYWHSYQSPLDYLLGRQGAREYLRRDVPSLAVYGCANARLRPDDRILLLNDSAQFYSEIPTLYSFTLDGERILLEESEAGVLDRLHELGITHVLLNYNGLAPLPGVAPRQGVYFFLDEGFRARYLEGVCAGNDVVLYRVQPRAGP